MCQFQSPRYPSPTYTLVTIGLLLYLQLSFWASRLLSGKDSACSVGDAGDAGSISEVRDP